MKSKECAKNLAEPANVEKPQYIIRYVEPCPERKKDPAKKGEKSIDKEGRIWYSNKAVGAVVSRGGGRKKKALDSEAKMW